MDEPVASSSSSRHRSRHSDRDSHDENTRKRHYDDDDGHSRSHKSSSSKKHRRSDDTHSHSKHHRSSSNRHGERHSNDASNGLNVVDDDGEDEWVEKDVTEGGERVIASDIPTAASMTLTSHASEPSSQSTPIPPPQPTESKLQRDEWMLLDPTPTIVSETRQPATSRAIISADDEAGLTEDYGDPTESRRTMGGGVDFFSSLGTERKKNRPEKPDPTKLVISSKELNVQLREGKSIDEYAAPTPAPKIVFGGPGSQWRMRKLQRTYEQAEEEDRPVEEVARERYDNPEEFEEAKEERRYLDERESRRSGGAGGPGGGRAPLPAGRTMESDSSTRTPSGGEKRWMFTDAGNPDTRPSSRNSFRRPGGDSTPSTPQPSSSLTTNPRVDALKGASASATKRSSFAGTPTGASSPVPSALVPTALLQRQQGISDGSPRKRALSPSSLNKLQARVLKAKLMNAPDAAALEKQFDEERRRAMEGPGEGEDETSIGDRIEMVPTVDAQGRLYDIGHGKNEPTPEMRPGNRRKKEKYVETRDRKTGELLRINADDDTMSLGDMLRHERSGAGMQDQRDMDAELARAITTDGKFQDDLEYMDDNAEKLGRKKMRTDAMKRQFAINDFSKSQKALAQCQFCFGEHDELPKAGVIAMGTRVYLSCTLNEELTEGHCYIVPIQHHFCMLEADDDVWEEVRNFMKCLIRMAAAANKGVMFYETVLNFKWQKHTYIECVPVPLEVFDELPAYFRESILASEAEWSQHKKLIDFSARPGGFRRAMVKNLPYFMVQWDYKGEKGYGHVIEGVGDSAAAGDDTGAQVDEGDRGGGEFPRWFAAEIIGNLIDVEPRRWRKPRRMDLRLNKERVDKFNKTYKKFDWTGMIGKST